VSEVKDFVKTALGSRLVELSEENGNVYVGLNQASILKSMSLLRARFRTLVDCFATDFTEEKGCFSIYYQLLSYEPRQRLFIITNVEKSKPAQSLVSLFENANWYEREIFDMFGIRFAGHPDMRSIFH
jgi:NADH:ubiquinone oxidoreductase subunit C